MVIKYYYCRHCGKIIAIVNDSDIPTMCCGESMVQIVPNTSDGAIEKHVPVINVKGNSVEITVGSEEHPMSYSHNIKWIVLQTNKGIHKKFISPNEKPRVEFSLTQDERVVSAFAYCNLHGLWQSKFS